MGAFLLDKTVLDRIEVVRKHAENYHFTAGEWKKLNSEEELKKHSFTVNQILLCPYGFIYVIMDAFREGEPVKVRRLISYGLNEEKIPHPLYVQEIMKLLGFKNRVEECYNYFEEDNSIINTIEPYE